MVRKRFFAAIIFGLMAMVIGPITASAATPSLAGSWQFTLTAANPTQTEEIPGLAAFSTDGSAVETDGSEYAPPPVSTGAAPKAATPGHGIWEVGNTPGSLFVEYFSLVLNPDGSLFARNVTSMLVSLSNKGKSFSGSYTTTQIIGSSSTLLASGTVSGTLIPHTPLP